ncbi:LysR family transcriptional regulator [Dactylosporangium matsuzakiense]|uniref:LysR family transcriptional regulator n=1 Tax=Dactylosporangium matsuzakiense TaxID=53360 RepID=A0A9W6KN97_9ACTN|nr:LysR family transcriptional regulator [Dactylosporangium matsuzakiense]UWZ47402.1 LysR family transcriptional regulator [Dactylosporangium matsuzakiense]GLL05147.1 LysR family transcriptional regulator [Dactylosporangium matsuzakiense]
MSELETRQLRYFVAVAEERHFGRAAERLGMAQPPLSRAVRALERQLGVQLLERTTRSVALTPAGESLLADARVALDAVARAERRARRAGEPVPSLRLALKADYDAGLLPKLLDAFTALPVELLLGGRGEQVAALHDGRADVALLPTPFDGRGLDTEPLLTTASVVALAAGDPLAARTSLRLADLTGRKLPGGTAAERGRMQPHASGRSFDLSQIFNLIEVGEVVWFLPAFVAERFPRPGLAYRPIEGVEPVTLAVAWPAESRSPAVAAFVRAAKAVAEAVSRTGGQYESVRLVSP